MATVFETTYDIYVFEDIRTAITGCLVFYDGHMYSTLADMASSALCLFDNTVDATDPADNTFPARVNATSFDMNFDY